MTSLTAVAPPRADTEVARGVAHPPALTFGLPVPGCTELFSEPDFLSAEESSLVFEQLLCQHSWPANHYEVFGRRFELPRLQTWHADDGIVYSYSNNLLKTRTWTPLLQNLRDRVERAIGFRFNSVLANYYRNGRDYVGWHSDDEIEMGEVPVIASLSLGSARTFSFRRKDNPQQVEEVILEPGSLLCMGPTFQRFWEHSVLADDSSSARINLTFRFVFPNPE